MEKSLEEKIKTVLEDDPSEKYTARQIKDVLCDVGTYSGESLSDIRSVMRKFYEDRYIHI